MVVRCLACGRGPGDYLPGHQTICLTCCPLEFSNGGTGVVLHRTGRAWGGRRILAAAEAGQTAPSTPTTHRSASSVPGSRPRSRSSSAIKSEIALETACAQASRTSSVPRRLFGEVAAGGQRAQRRRGRKQAWSSQQPPQKACAAGPRPCSKDSTSNTASDVGVQQLHVDSKPPAELHYSRLTAQTSDLEIGHLGVLGYVIGVDHDQQKYEQQQRQQQQQQTQQPQPQLWPQSQPRPSTVPLGARIPRQGMERPLKEIRQLGKFPPRSICRSRSGSLPARLPPPGWEFPR